MYPITQRDSDNRALEIDAVRIFKALKQMEKYLNKKFTRLVRGRKYFYNLVVCHIPTTYLPY